MDIICPCSPQLCINPAQYHPVTQPPLCESTMLIKKPEHNTESFIVAHAKSLVTVSAAGCTDKCAACNALHWKEEQNVANRNKEVNTYPTCCHRGAAVLPTDYTLDFPARLRGLFTGLGDGAQPPGPALLQLCVMLTDFFCIYRVRAFQATC